MNIYADRGNLTVFERRCAWRGLGFELAGAGIGDAIDPDAHDLFYIGGGQDRDQALCADDLATAKRDALHAAAGRGAVVFAVCGGYQLLGDGYELADERLPGVGLVDLDTRREDGPRLIGNVAIELDLPGGPASLAGFENHAGRTYLGAGTAPLGRVLRATGTTARTAPRAFAAGRTARSSAPTCTARCCRRTPGSRTGSSRPRSGIAPARAPAARRPARGSRARRGRARGRALTARAAVALAVQEARNGHRDGERVAVGVEIFASHPIGVRVMLHRREPAELPHELVGGLGRAAVACDCGAALEPPWGMPCQPTPERGPRQPAGAATPA